MKIIEFFENKETPLLIEKYTLLTNVEELFKKSIQDLHTTECILPVLGVQGTGKSSFLNALLFGDIVLPVDAVETTCIPTIVRYGKNDKPVAFVVFGEGKKQPIECSEPGLGEFVHQDKNPGNRLGVSHIEILWNNDLLANGITLVDLPGVGSITAANQKTTMEFLKKSTGAIFMLRTTPTITASEATFIQGALPLMGHVFWVQNQWTDDAPNDLKESMEENYATLKKIAKNIRQPENIIAEPEVVCVKHALDGRILRDQQMIDGSGINQFRKKIIDFKSTWQQAVVAGKAAQAHEMINNALASAEATISRLSGDIETELAKVRQQKKKADEIAENNRGIARDAKNYLAEQNITLLNFINKQCTIFAENLRNDVREVIGSGVVGGEHLNKAFQDHLEERQNELFEAIQPEFLAIIEQLTKNLSGLTECGFVEKKIAVETDFTEKTKIHEFYGRGGGLAGLIGGGYAGSALLGTAIAETTIAAKIGAAIGCGVGPVGVAIGAGIGALVGVFMGSFFGNKAKKVHVESQQEKAERELFKYVSTVQNEAKKTYTDSFNTFISDVGKSISNWLDEQEKQIEAEYRKAKAEIEKPAETKQVEKEAIARDVATLKQLRDSLEA